MPTSPYSWCLRARPSPFARGYHRAGEIQGQTRQLYNLANSFGATQNRISVSQMGCVNARYKQERYDPIANVMTYGFSPFVGDRVSGLHTWLVPKIWRSPVLVVAPIGPWIIDERERDSMIAIHGWMGDNILNTSDNMSWLTGQDLEAGKETLHVETLYDMIAMC